MFGYNFFFKNSSEYLLKSIFPKINDMNCSLRTGVVISLEKFCLSKERNTDNIKLINNRPRKFGPINKTKIFGPIIIDQFISPNFA